jgi:hypothetical protein
MQNEIIIKQNETDLVKLLRASTVAYTKAKNGEIVVTDILIILAIAFPISFVLIKNENVKLILFGCSFLLSVIIQIFTNTLTGNTSKGAIFKELFDTTLFNMSWKSTIEHPEHSEISKYSLQYKGPEIKDWYSNNISASIPHNISIAVLQHSNTIWDIQLRIIYRKWLIGFLLVYSIILWIFLLYHDSNGITIFLIYFSILTFCIHMITLIRGHSSVIKKREKISKHLDKLILKKKNISDYELRDIQDEIFLSRQETAKVPNWFFRRYKKRINAIDEDYIASVNKIYINK